MRLYLSSYLWGSKPNELFEMLGENRHAALITNSADQFPEEGIVERLNQDQEYLTNAGITSDRLDLRDYFDDKTKLEIDLRKFGFIWVRGANVFVLRRAFAQSGLDILLPKLLTQDALVYGGYSAGACIMGSTLKGLDLVDDAYVAPVGYKPEVIWGGLNIVPYAIAPHYKSNHPESKMIDDAVDFFEANNITYKALRDGEAVIVNGEKESVVG
jgi:dipeptidase E